MQIAAAKQDTQRLCLPHQSSRRKVVANVPQHSRGGITWELVLHSFKSHDSFAPSYMVREAFAAGAVL